MFRRFTDTLPKLGRWACTSEAKNAIKVLWANMDHCGTCRPIPETKETKETKEPKKPITKPKPTTR